MEQFGSSKRRCTLMSNRFLCMAACVPRRPFQTLEQTLEGTPSEPGGNDHFVVPLGLSSRVFDHVDEDRNMLSTVGFGRRATGSVFGSRSTQCSNMFMHFSSDPRTPRHAGTSSFQVGLSRQHSRALWRALAESTCRMEAFSEEGSDRGGARDVRGPGRDVSLRNLCFFAVKSSRLFRESRVNTSTPSTCAAKTRDE